MNVDGLLADYVEGDITPNGNVDGRHDYIGYATEPVFGVLNARELWDLGDESCARNDKRCYVRGDDIEDEATMGTFDDSLRLELREGSSDERVNVNGKEFDIDFQAFTLDMAGNIGFSDADPANPRFINDLGEQNAADREEHDALGYYSAHVITLDEKDPEIISAQTATGYYGLDGGNPMPDRSGLMIVFDGDIDPSSVSMATFNVILDDGNFARFADLQVDGRFVFLRTAEPFASDATPLVDIASGEFVEDLAGNETFGREVDEFEAADGIAPILTVTLSGGTGRGTGSEGPDQLTMEQMTAHIASDEPLQGAPRIAFVCSNIAWETDSADQDIDDFIANRNVATNVSEPGDNADDDDYFCGSLTTALTPRYQNALARPGENWEFVWDEHAEGIEFPDGGVTAVAFGRDRSRYDGPNATGLRNWGSASAEFTLDRELISLIDVDGNVDSRGGDVQPSPGTISKEDRPFIFLEFSEPTSVTLDSVLVDGMEVAMAFEETETNRFVYWPLSMSIGEHEVEVEASDAAGNEQDFSFTFEKERRGDFIVRLQAGWNAISLPANPVDTAINSVFDNQQIDTIMGWDTQSWRIARRSDGAWISNQQFAPLNEIRAGYGYWVRSNNFVQQAITLQGRTSSRLERPQLFSIDTQPGWNFVGVVDQDGDQIEDHFGASLLDSDSRPVSALTYLGAEFVRAYTWDATFHRFDVVREDSDMTIGTGVWVYYPEGTGIAP